MASISSTGILQINQQFPLHMSYCKPCVNFLFFMNIMKWPPDCQMKSTRLSVELLYLTRRFLSDMLLHSFAVFMKVVMLIYTECSKHLHAHVPQPFFQPAIGKAHPSAQNSWQIFLFSSPK